MSIEPLSLLVYEITCSDSECRKPFLLSIAQVVAEKFTHCPACHKRIEASEYYSRHRVIELMQKVGYQGAFVSVNDSQ